MRNQVWEAWDQGEIDDQVAWLMWWLIVEGPVHHRIAAIELAESSKGR